MTWRHLAGGLSLALITCALSGCGTAASGSGITIPDLPSPSSPGLTLTGNPFKDFAPLTAKIAMMTTEDVDTALADAQHQNPADGVGVACWSTVKVALPLLQLPKGSGIATAIQRGRDVQSIAPTLLNQCSAIIPFLSPALPIIP